MIHISTLQEFINKLYDEGATYVDIKELLQLFKSEGI